MRIFIRTYSKMMVIYSSVTHWEKSANLGVTKPTQTDVDEQKWIDQEISLILLRQLQVQLQERALQILKK